MNPFKEKDLDNSKIRFARLNCKAFLQVPEKFMEKMEGELGEKLGDKVKKTFEEKGGEMAASAAAQMAAGAAGRSPQPVQPQFSQGTKAPEQWARAEMAVEEAKRGAKDHLPRAAEILVIIAIIGLLFYAPLLESGMLKNIILIGVCALIIFKEYLYQWLRQRIHIPEHIADPMLLFNLGIAILVIASDMSLMAALILILVSAALTTFGPYIAHKIHVWRLKRKAEHPEKVEKKKKTLEERAKSVMKGSMIIDGVDFGVGFIPVVGDIIGFLISLRLPVSSLFHRLIGVGDFAKMIIICIFDSVVGFIPGLGDVADLFPANMVNAHILKKSVKAKQEGLEASGGGSMILFLAIIVAGGLGLFVFVIAPILGNFGGPLGDAMSSIAAAPSNAYNYMKDHNPVTWLKNTAKKQVMMATGDFYTSKVDENAGSNLGVYLDDLKQADPTFYVENPAIMYTTLRVETLDKPVPVSLFCECSGEQRDADPTISPSTSFNVTNFAEEDIDCIYQPGELKKGNWRFEIGADFEFKTMSYIHAYFMDAEAKRGLQSRGIDPLLHNGVSQKPQAISTAGPISIGMGGDKMPFGLDSSKEEEVVRYGVQLTNKEAGTVKGIKKFLLIFPKEFELIGALGEGDFEPADCTALPEEDRGICNNETDKVFEAESSEETEIESGEWKTFIIYFGISKEEFDKILGIDGFGRRNFKALAVYDYRISKTKSVNIKSQNKATLVGDSGSVDITGPEITFNGAERLDNGNTLISWETDEDATCTFTYFDVAKPNEIIGSFETALSEEHEKEVSGLSSSKSYGYTIVCVDESGRPSNAGSGKYFNVGGSS